MDDLISRQVAIDCEYQVKIINDIEYVMLSEVQMKMRKLPSAQPERKKGKWIDYTDDGYVECPFCHSATNCDGNKDELHYCFSCGADMRGE